MENLKNVTSLPDRISKVSNDVVKVAKDVDPTTAKVVGGGLAAVTSALIGKKFYDSHKAKKAEKEAALNAAPAVNVNVAPRYMAASESIDCGENKYKDAIVTALIASAVGAGASGILTPISDTVRGATSKLIDKVMPGVRDYGYGRNNPTKVPYKAFEVKDVKPQVRYSSTDKMNDWLKENLGNSTLADINRYESNNLIPKEYQVKLDQLKEKLFNKCMETGKEDLTMGDVL